MRRRRHYELEPDVPAWEAHNWIAYGDPRIKCRRYQMSVTPDDGRGHTELEIWVIHCGHPTAVWPYYGEAYFADTMFLGPTGRGFQYLDDAKDALWTAYYRHVEAGGDPGYPMKIPSPFG